MTDRALQLAEMLKHQLAHTHIQLRTIAFPLIEELAALSQGAPEGRAPDRAVAPQAVSVADWHRDSITLTARQLQTALDLLIGGGIEDDDQWEDSVSIAWAPDGVTRTDEGEPEPAGYRAWMTDYPDEGCVSLDDPPPLVTPDVQAARAATQPARDCDSTAEGPGDEAISDMVAHLATQPAPSRDSTPQASSNSGAEGQQAEPITRIAIPTETMEQEFQSHYRRGYAAGQQAARSEAPAGWQAVWEAALRWYRPEGDSMGACAALHKAIAAALTDLAASPPSAQPAEKL